GAAARSGIVTRPTERQRATREMATSRPLAQLLSSLAGEPARWTRSAPGGATVAVDAALQAWLAAVDTAATGWQAAGDRAARPEDRAAPTTARSTIVLDRDGRTGAVLRIEDGGVAFETPAGTTWFAPLAPDAVARLRATLPPPAR
ncbi:MAG: hypothetical protein ACXWJ1_16265, partial [Caldimonas sp.]